MGGLNYFHTVPLPPTPFVLDRKGIETLKEIIRDTERDGRERSVTLCTTPDTEPVALPAEQCVGSHCQVRVYPCKSGEKPVASFHTHPNRDREFSVGDLIRALWPGEEKAECVLVMDRVLGPWANCAVRVRDISQDKLREFNQEFWEKIQPAYDRATASGEDLRLTPEEEEAYWRLKKELLQYVTFVEFPLVASPLKVKIGDKSERLYFREFFVSNPELMVIPTQEMCDKWQKEEFARLLERAEQAAGCDDAARVAWQLGAAELLVDHMLEVEGNLIEITQEKVGLPFEACHSPAIIAGSMLADALNKAKELCAGEGKG